MYQRSQREKVIQATEWDNTNIIDDASSQKIGMSENIGPVRTDTVTKDSWVL